MGGLFSGSSKTTTNNTVTSAPQQFQQDAVTKAFDAASKNYSAASGTPFYQGDLYAGMSDSAKADLAKTRDYALTTGLGTANTLSSIGQSLSGYAGKAGSSIEDYLALANGDATADNIAAASKYADNPYLSGQIDAVNRDVARNLAEVTLPTIDRTASGTGNINSSRAGVASGIAQRGAEDRMADNAAALRSQAYSQGLTLAQGDRSQRLNALGTASQAYTGLAGMGLNALSAGADAGYGAMDVINRVNASDQADRQGQADADFQRWQGEDTREADLLDRYYRIIGANQWGGTTTEKGSSTTKSSPGLASLAFGGLSLAGGLGFKPF